MSDCQIEGCTAKAVGRGLCPKHYARWRKYGDPSAVKQKQLHGATLAERLMAGRFVAPSGCWEWTGSKDAKGYGRLNIDDKPFLVHRASWTAFRGAVPDGQHVLHRCDNPSCFRPEHLFLGDHSANMADKMAKKRHRYGVSHGTAHGMAKLTDDQVREIRASTGPSRITAEQYGISGRQVRDIRTRNVWKHLP